jgi:hypothetical protein
MEKQIPSRPCPIITMTPNREEYQRASSDRIQSTEASVIVIT